MKKFCKFTFLFYLTCVSLCACGPFMDSRKELNPDLIPPVFKEIVVQEEGKVILIFDEPTKVQSSDISFRPELTLIEIFSQGNEVHLTVSIQVPGKEYTITATCEDDRGNSLLFIATFYGYNPHTPDLLINEFITQGSSTHPDLVEVKVIESGNMGGVVCYQGTYHNWDDRLIFPAFGVQQGDFILIHFKPQGLESEIDETDEKDVSGGLDASPEAFDFWIKGGTGISGNNGVLSLYESPGGRIIDGVLYSNRTTESDEDYLGFGTRKVMERALELVSSEGWHTEQEQIRPEDGINPDDSTATRSLCRDRTGTDSDTKYDWHIVPTRKSSFGEENCEEEYND